MPQREYPDHPYKKYEAEPLWQVLDQAIAELEGNDDLTLTTARQYVIGFLCQAVFEPNVVLPFQDRAENGRE